MAAPLSTEVLDASYGVLHELRANQESQNCVKTQGVIFYSTPTLATYPAVNLNIDGVEIAVGSANIDELDQRPNTDALEVNICT